MVQYRKERLEKNYYYHVFSRSIAKYKIFNDPEDYNRIIEIIELLRYSNFDQKYSKYLNLDVATQFEILYSLKKQNDVLGEIVAYCIMPTHIHLILKQIKDKGISQFMARVLNSYSRYFNVKYRRQGPLWTGRFKSVLVQNDEQLLHLTRYIHLNPSSAGIVSNPEKWQYSSFKEYINFDQKKSQLCCFENLIEIKGESYKKFVLDRKDYQRQLSLIKNLIIDDYVG